MQLKQRPRLMMESHAQVDPVTMKTKLHGEKALKGKPVEEEVVVQVEELAVATLQV